MYDDLIKHIGVKIINAKPMTEQDFRRSKGMTPEENEDILPGYKVVYEDGYTSWSPKGVFEKAYRQANGMNFGLAIEALKMGKKVARTGWNGKGMHLEIVKEYTLPESKLGHLRNGLLPWIGMKTATDGFVPWLASQTDMLSDDWEIVE
ncbi:DUF2829 domain-containing protein [Candidatus Pacearchaeota archaeon]|nr:DUF2829 domain-containing protein [Candidatus Pacearchaeota archaeon]